MLRFILHKIANKKWMMLALLIGNVLLIGITISNALYEHAALQQMLSRNLSNSLVQHNAYPGLTTVKASVNAIEYQKILDKAERMKDIPARMGIGAVDTISLYATNAIAMEPELVRDDDTSSKYIEAATLSDLREHIRITSGRMFADAPDADGIVDVIVSESGLVKMNLLLDEIITVPKFIASDGAPLRLRIAGVFTNSRPDDIYWIQAPQAYAGQLFMAEPIFKEWFASKAEPTHILKGTWYTLLDYTAIQREDTQKMLAASQAFGQEFSLSYSDTYSDNFTSVLTRFLEDEKKFSVTLWVLQIPIYVLVCAFIFMVSRQALESEQNEIAVLKSRGASKRQLITVYLLQSVMMAIVGLLLGAPLGIFLCRALGSSNAFLAFVQRKALVIEWNATVLLFAAVAAVLAIAAMVLPVLKFANVTIVTHKQKGRRANTPWWQKAFLDVLLLGVSLYGLYTFSQQKELIAQRVAEGAALDPLLFLSSSLFMLGAGLVSIRILPLIAGLVYRLFQRWWSPALTASFLQVLRSRANRGFITVFLVLTIAMGIFNAQAARTINSNKEDNIRYTVGADVVVKETWQDNRGLMAMNPSLKLSYYEPDFVRYQTLLDHGVERMTKVAVDDKATLPIEGGTLRNVRVMGIHTKEFGQTIWFRDSLLPHHINQYLNTMSQDAQSVLVSKNLETDYGYQVGDLIYYKNAEDNGVNGVICGFVDYWPSYAPVKNVLGEDGVYTAQPQYLIVAHLSMLQSSWGVTPYQIWMKVPGSTRAVYDFAQQTGIQFEQFADVSAMMVALKNDPVFQSTNGVLTIAFIVVLLLCSVGFLIYWILSIRSRALQFGIFRAMGMSIREVVTMLLNEQIWISALAIAAGMLVGSLASEFYIPLIQIAYTSTDQALPTVVVAASSDALRLMLVVGAMMLLCMTILAMIIRNFKIAQVLKLGEE